MVTALLPIKHFLQVQAGAFNKVGADYAQRNGVNLDPNNPVTNRRSTAELTYFGKALTSFDAGQNHTFELGVSTLQVPDRKIRRNLIGMDFTYKWHPSGTSLKERLVWSTELLRNQETFRYNRDQLVYGQAFDDSGAPIQASDANSNPLVDAAGNPVYTGYFASTDITHRSRTSFGGYSYAEYFYDRHWSFGPKFDFNRPSADFVPGQPSQTFGTDGQPWLAPDGTIQKYSKRTSRGGYESTSGTFLTYKFSEFSRMRFEYNFHRYPDRDAANEFFLQWTVFLGAHVHGFDQR